MSCCDTNHTYTFGDAITTLMKNNSAKDEANFAALACNIAMDEMWKQYDFRETLADLPPFCLTPNEQLYGAPQLILPTDFLGLRRAYLVNTNNNPATKYPLKVIKDVDYTHIRDLPREIGYSPEACALMVHPNVPENIGSPNWLVTGVYKKTTPRVTSETYPNTKIPFKDIYFMNILEVIKWAIYKLSNNPLAGNVEADRYGSMRATGQYAVALDALFKMSQSEGLELGDPVIAPAEGLIAPNLYSGYPYGYL
jgi:hypothetical protein